MPPTQQRFQAGHPFFRDIDQRLVINLKSVLNIGGPQQRFHVAAGLGAFIHLRFEESISAAPFGFGGVHGKIGALEQILRLVTSFGRDRNADAGADVELIPVNLVGTADQLDQPVREHSRAFGLVGFQLYDGEFVAAEARDAVAVANALNQSIGDAFQQTVPGRVAERIVDALEAIEVDEQYGDVGAGWLRQYPLEVLAEQNTVGKPGETVMVGEIMNVRFLVGGPL